MADGNQENAKIVSVESSPEDFPDIFEATLTDITRNQIHQAPVELPDQEELTVRLVQIHLIQTLLDSKSDFEMYISVSFALVGVLMGSIGTILSQPEVVFSTHMLLFVGLLVLIMIFLTIRTVVLRRRYMTVKRRIFK